MARIAHELDDADIRDSAKNERLRIFAQNLNRLLSERNIHQVAFAKAVGISTGSLSDYRHGIKEPKLSALLKMADYLEIDCHYLMTGTRSKYSDATGELGLSDKAMEMLKKEARHNLMYWRMDMINFLLEHELFPQLLDLLLGLAVSKEKEVMGIPITNNFVPLITDRDVYRSTVIECIRIIGESCIGLFDNRHDSRFVYNTYHEIFLRRDEDVRNQIKKELEEGGYIYDDDMFRDEDRQQNSTKKTDS